MSLSGTVFIDRANRKDAVASFDSAVRQIQGDKQSVWIFPEGTRSNFTTPDLLPFKKGAFHLAIQAGVAIVPVVVQNYSHLYNTRNRTFNSGTVKVVVLDPITTVSLTAADVDALAIDTRQKMLMALEALHPNPEDLVAGKATES